MSEQHGFIIAVEVIERGAYAQAYQAALDTARRIFDEDSGESCITVKPTGESLFVGVPNGVYCEGCEGCIYPGIRWPAATNGDSSRSWVERCDTCERYDSDDAAAEYLLEVYRDAGATIVHGEAIAAGTINPTPFVEVS